jgi:hypothetical protein
MTTYRLYISGPMSGLPDENRPAFAEAERQLRAAGYDVFNPASQPDVPRWKTGDYLVLRDLPALRRCHGLAYLKCWNDRSVGAQVERWYAIACKMHIAPVDTWTIYEPAAWAEDCDPQVARVAALPPETCGFAPDEEHMKCGPCIDQVWRYCPACGRKLEPTP